MEVGAVVVGLAPVGDGEVPCGIGDGREVTPGISGSNDVLAASVGCGWTPGISGMRDVSASVGCTVTPGISGPGCDVPITYGSALWISGSTSPGSTSPGTTFAGTFVLGETVV